MEGPTRAAPGVPHRWTARESMSMVRAATDFVDQTALHQNLVGRFSAEGDPTVTLSSLEDDQHSSLLSDYCESST